MRKLFLFAFVVILAGCASVQKPPQAKVARLWHGKVLTSRADEYERYLNENGVNRLRAIPGNLGVQMFRHADGDVTHFVVISYWPSEEAIRAWAGDVLTRTRLMPRDPEFLIDPELTVIHYDIKVQDW